MKGWMEGKEEIVGTIKNLKKLMGKGKDFILCLCFYLDNRLSGKFSVCDVYSTS
jgi:hypothetical protein